MFLMVLGLTFRRAASSATVKYVNIMKARVSSASLSILSPANVECRRCPSGVPSVNSIYATSSGFSHRQFCISLFVRLRAHGPHRFWGRFEKEHFPVRSTSSSGNRAQRICGTNPLRTSTTNFSFAPSVAADDKSIEGIAGYTRRPRTPATG